MPHNVLFLEVFLLSSWTAWNFALIPGAKEVGLGVLANCLDGLVLG